MTTFYTILQFLDQADQPVSLHDYKGKVVLNRQYSNRLWFDATVSGLCRNSMINTKNKDSRFLIFLVISLWDRHLVMLKKSIPSAPQLPDNLSLVCQNQGQW